MHRYFATQIALALVAAGEGMALIPMLALQGAQQDGVETLDVPGLGTRPIVLRSHSRGMQANNLVSAVTSLLHEVVSHLTDDDGATTTSYLIQPEPYSSCRRHQM